MIKFHRMGVIEYYLIFIVVMVIGMVTVRIAHPELAHISRYEITIGNSVYQAEAYTIVNHIIDFDARFGGHITSNKDVLVVDRGVHE